MSIKNLAPLLHPRSIAIIGASTRPDAIGSKILDNVLRGGFAGDIWPVNPKHARILEQSCYPSVSALPAAPDIAIVATPAPTIPSLLRELGEKGTKIAVLVTAGLSDKNGLRQAALEASKPYGLRLFGPNVVGLILPTANLNASFVLTGASRGNIGLLSQSGAIVSSLLDWAGDHDIGFSQVISLGDMIDVDIGDAIDLLATDHETSAIIIYLESIVNPRKFISAARAAGRLKPLIAIVPGRHKAAAAAAATHTGALASNNRILDAVLKRAGIIRVMTLSELFAAAEITARFPPLSPTRIAIVTNGGGAGVLAVDSLLDKGEVLASLTAETVADLDRLLPGGWSRNNPVDVAGDATPDRYAAAVRTIAADTGVDAVLALHCPVQAAPPAVTALAVAGIVQEGTVAGKPLLTCFLGGKAARDGRQILRGAGISDHEMPDDAIAALHILAQWGRRKEQLTHIAGSTTKESSFDRNAAFGIFEEAASEGRAMLTEIEAKGVLGAYGIPVPEYLVAGTIAAVDTLATRMLRHHPAIVLKILSRKITHKSDIGGVALNLTSTAEVRRAARKMKAAATTAGFADQIDGYVLQPMVKVDNGFELLAGLSADAVFGPAIVFGAGGIAVEQTDDVAMGLPPLDDGLADDLIKATRIDRLLQGFRHIPAADRDAIKKVLLALSQMAVDFPFVRAVDINPLVAGSRTIIALDARIEIDPSRLREPAPNRNLVIRPYPAGWSSDVTLRGQCFSLRPILPLDAELYAGLLEQTTADDLRMRFFGQTRLSEAAIVRMTHIDYEREMAFVAINPVGQLVGVSRLVIDAGREWGEYGVLVRSDQQRIGLGTALLQQLLTFARAEGLAEVRGAVLRSNEKMLGLCRKLGFEVVTSSGDASLKQVRIRLSDPNAAGGRNKRDANTGGHKLRRSFPNPP
ncbi:bifunctional acetate--CoA ligase family protein/GNAT family N-acetyltransferase (plasmid) [Rhizobium sullae]|uniref:Bifunctional acetate--CoA ligase family protein/GNAT family N-acetyltransferase n=1 Tax=Rhizobium sullae TaxID=50338 RepID=A0ABY5XVM9_RHISU|nr:bifunctional acetate--CoA ligase family protein/GNAT family N-acetyltransferase [Rhizobium sullae]UWU18678.1 bifunctional acetate--CoA ligase family protein/GNAT family N-acetyltransferase [Rhizobium sullae]